MITDFGCSTAKFAEPDIICFGERFLLDNNGQAICYIGNSSLGFTTTAINVPDEFYGSLFRDSLREVGSAHITAKTKLFEKLGNSGVNKIFAYTNSLLGDPTVQLKIPTKPNLLLNSSSVILPGSSIQESSDSVKIGIIIENDGLAPLDSFYVSVNHQLSNGEVVDNFEKRFLIPAFRDTIFYYFNIKNKTGQNILSITLDSKNEVDEIYKNDNTHEYNFVVYSSKLRDLVENIVENPAIQKITILNPSQLSIKNPKIDFQISSTKDFANSNNLSFSADSFFTQVSLPALEPNRRYWYRFKIDSTSSEYNSPKSFYNVAGGNFYLMIRLLF